MPSSVQVTVAFRICYVGVMQVVLSYLAEASDNADLPWVILHDPVSKEEISP